VGGGGVAHSFSTFSRKSHLCPCRQVGQGGGFWPLANPFRGFAPVCSRTLPDMRSVATVCSVDLLRRFFLASAPHFGALIRSRGRRGSGVMNMIARSDTTRSPVSVSVCLSVRLSVSVCAVTHAVSPSGTAVSPSSSEITVSEYCQVT